MNTTIKKLMNGWTENHILPFFWLHGEEENILREYMQAIYKANCHAVCVESRPHPDFCGEKWWKDMEIILEEARSLGMKVWILDDSHFPTGFANGAVKTAPDELCRQNIFCSSAVLEGNSLNLREEGLLTPPKYEIPAEVAAFMDHKDARSFDDDILLGVTAVHENGQRVDVTAFVEDGILRWNKPKGGWTVFVCTASRNTGYHRDYINMLDRRSCRLLIDAVYEPHWQHFAQDFGTTIAGFFSDEPELGNGLMYAQGNMLGTGKARDIPWSEELQMRLSEKIGDGWQTKLHLLWYSDNMDETARVRYAYMDALTELVKEDFSYQIGDWCREHGIAYIGHMIEDNGQHCRTGSSLGHYFRGLEGQNMAGIDDIGGQVLPQGEDGPKENNYGQPRQGEFYHYGLAALARSAAAIEPGKQGRAMCEIFGNYGWQEGVHLEKYLADHFMVRGINYFVPHAFSGKAFPDPDCPPHFYAHGHHPQYRHFGELMKYMNRVAAITSSKKHVVAAAVLYHGEAQWCDNGAMPFEKSLHRLYDGQIDCHVLPADVFARFDFYQTQIGRYLTVNGQEYRVFIIPGAEYIPKAVAKGIVRLHECGMPVLFVDKYPKALCDSGETLPKALFDCSLVSLENLHETVRALGIPAPKLSPECGRVRVLHIGGDHPVFYIVNEGEIAYEGTVVLPAEDSCYIYDAWQNRCERADSISTAGGTQVSLYVEPQKSCILVFGTCDFPVNEPLTDEGIEIPTEKWYRSICESAGYPSFEGRKEVVLPDQLAEEELLFSGFVRYETIVTITDMKGKWILDIEDAAEGVEVFANGRSAGIQIASPYRYNLTEHVRTGYNYLVIEVATTLERKCYPLLEGFQKKMAPEPSAKSGITGRVRLLHQ